MNITYEQIYRLMQTLYENGMRDILKNAVDDPKAQWDDFMMKIVDGIMGYDSES